MFLGWLRSRCPFCGSLQLTRSHRRGILERIIGVMLLPYRCEEQDDRFFKFRWLKADRPRCEICMVLIDRLAKASNDLATLARQLGDTAKLPDLSYDDLLRDVAQLRTECAQTRTDLMVHRAHARGHHGHSVPTPQIKTSYLSILFKILTRLKKFFDSIRFFISECQTKRRCANSSHPLNKSRGIIPRAGGRWPAWCRSRIGRLPAGKPCCLGRV
jgi:hypothetical protein